jgi:hypothetical protein
MFFISRKCIPRIHKIGDNMELKKVLAAMVFLVLALVSSASIMSVQALPTSTPSNPFNQLFFGGYACIHWQGTNGYTQTGTYCGKATLQFVWTTYSHPYDIIMDLNGMYPYGLTWNYKGAPVVYGDFVLVCGEPIAVTAHGIPPFAVASPVTIIVHNKAPFHVIVLGCCAWFSGQAVTLG